jgi:hypothetical protein
MLRIGWLIVMTLSTELDAQAPSRLLTGPALQRRLQDTIGISWSEMPLRRGVYDLCGRKQVAVLLDRRVDPGRKVSLSVGDAPLEDVLHEIAKSQELGLTFLGPVAYFGPPGVVVRLRSLAEMRREEIRRLPLAVAGTFLRLKSMQWNDLATPRELLGQLAEEAQVSVSGLERVPHDLWAGAALPPLAWIDRLTLGAGARRRDAGADLSCGPAAGGACAALGPGGAGCADQGCREQDLRSRAVRGSRTDCRGGTPGHGPGHDASCQTARPCFEQPTRGQETLHDPAGQGPLGAAVAVAR